MAKTKIQEYRALIGLTDTQTVERLNAHIQGGTSAEWIASTLTKNGYPIGATAIKDERRRMKECAS